MSLRVDLDRIISATEARRNFGKLLSEVSSDGSKYFVILDNGRIAALLVNSHWFGKQAEPFDLQDIRKDWGRHAETISQALQNLEEMDRERLPRLLQE